MKIVECSFANLIDGAETYAADWRVNPYRAALYWRRPQGRRLHLADLGEIPALLPDVPIMRASGMEIMPVPGELKRETEKNVTVFKGRRKAAPVVTAFQLTCQP